MRFFLRGYRDSVLEGISTMHLVWNISKNALICIVVNENVFTLSYVRRK